MLSGFNLLANAATEIIGLAVAVPLLWIAPRRTESTARLGADVGTHFSDELASLVPCAKGLALPVPGIWEVFAGFHFGGAEKRHD
jgi:hypothetical protein